MRHRLPNGTFTKEMFNDVVFEGDVAILKIVMWDGSIVNCKVDAVDYPLVKPYRWGALRRQHTTHIWTARLGDHTYMHTLLTGFTKTDHWDTDGTNNRRGNLRECTQQENGRNCGPKKNNKSGYKGVSFYKGKYHADISTGEARFRLGHFMCPEDAARAYDKAAKEHFGEFAWLNFPDTEAAHVGQ